MRFHEAANTGDADVIAKTIDDLVHSDAAIRTPLPIGATGAEALKQVWAMLLRIYRSCLLSRSESLCGPNGVGRWRWVLFGGPARLVVVGVAVSRDYGTVVAWCWVVWPGLAGEVPALVRCRVRGPAGRRLIAKPRPRLPIAAAAADVVRWPGRKSAVGGVCAMLGAQRLV